MQRLDATIRDGEPQGLYLRFLGTENYPRQTDLGSLMFSGHFFHLPMSVPSELAEETSSVQGYSSNLTLDNGC